MYRTPVKVGQSPDEESIAATTGNTTFEIETAPQTGRTNQSNVRKSIGEWESGQQDTNRKLQSPPKIAKSVEPPKIKPPSKPTTSRRPSVEIIVSPIRPTKKYADRLTEARACLLKAKQHLGNSRNLKTEIKTEVLLAVDRLYQLVKESESAKPSKPQIMEDEMESEDNTPKVITKEQRTERKENRELIERIEEHTRLMKESNEKMESLKESMEKQQESLQRQTYASVAAAPTRTLAPEQTALHSVVISARDEMETGEQVLERIRSVINAKEGGIVVEKIRKAKDRKIIVGCRTEEEKRRFTEKLKGAEELNVEDLKNKDPMVILRSVLKHNTDEDVITALRKQNSEIFAGTEDHQLEIRYKRQTRNPLAHDIIMRVSPKLWQKMTNSSTVQIDLQRIRVADQSPLVQCSQCLGYGHGKRFCKEALPKCSHCGGPHLKADCPDHELGATPTCCNCMHAKMEKTSHNAFSAECPIRRKWDGLARASIAYC